MSIRSSYRGRVRAPLLIVALLLIVGVIAGGGLEQFAGVALVLFTVADVFLTVLFPRMGTSLLGGWISNAGWQLFRRSSGVLPGGPRVVMPFCGPVLVVLLVMAWAALLTFGAALLIHPALGHGVQAHGVQAPAEQQPTDFISALYAGGSSLSLVGNSNFSPQTSGFRLVYLVHSFIGASVLSLTLTYLMQLYAALHRRNALGLRIHEMTGNTGDAAELLARLLPRGEQSGTYTNLAALADEMTQVKESHHFYPMLFYFRFSEPEYAVSRFCLVSVDLVSLIDTALDDRRCGWIAESASVAQLRRAALVLVTSLDETFVGSPRALPGEGESTPLGWAPGRYRAALARLRAAGLPITGDAQAGGRRYAEQRATWQPSIARLAPALCYPLEVVDPAGVSGDGSPYPAQAAE